MIATRRLSFTGSSPSRSSQKLPRCFSTEPCSSYSISCPDNALSRRKWLLATLGALVVQSPSSLAMDDSFDANKLINENNTQITAKVVMEFGYCTDKLRFNRSLGEGRFCIDVKPIGAITIGVYGDRLPTTVANFVRTAESGAYNGTKVNRLRSGEFFAIGKQGMRRNGEMENVPDLDSNPELTATNAFMLRHFRAGTVSLAVGANDDPPDRTLSSNYHPTQILITTGPGPAPKLDRENVVFGRVIDGFDTLGMIAQSRTYRPSERVQSFNALASAIGDERAAEARKTWERPIDPIIIISAKSIAV